MNYKIVASDMDGTLLNSQGKLSRENLEAIEKLDNMGVYFVPSSGRTFNEMTDELTANPHVRYYICSNGAVIYDKQKDTHTYLCMDKRKANIIYDITKKYDVHITVRYDNRAHADKKQLNNEAYLKYNICDAHRSVLENYTVAVDDIADVFKDERHFETIALFFTDKISTEKCKTEIEAAGEFDAVCTWGNCIEIIDKTSGKGSALKALAEMTGIGIENTIAVGDSDNDMSMIKAAGLGLAVSNACDELKAIADKVICSNDEHNIKYIYENILNK